MGDSVAVAGLLGGLRLLDWGTVPDWIVAVTAVATALYASYQITLLRIARQDAVEAQQFAADQRAEYLKIQQGLQLMEIDKQYENVLQPSRKKLLALRRRLMSDLPDDGPQKQQLIANRVSDCLKELRQQTMAGSAEEREAAVEEYFCLTQLPNYIETMGVLADAGLVDEAAMLRLYDGMVDRVIGDVLPHIYWRRQEDDNPNYLIFAEALFKKASARMKEAQAKSRC